MLTQTSVDLVNNVNSLLSIGYNNTITKFKEIINVDTRPILAGRDVDILEDLFENATISNDSQNVTENSIYQKQLNNIKIGNYASLKQTYEDINNGVDLDNVSSRIAESVENATTKIISDNILSVIKGVAALKYATAVEIKSTGGITINAVNKMLNQVGDNIGKNVVAFTNSTAFNNFTSTANYGSFALGSGELNLMTSPFANLKFSVTNNITANATAGKYDFYFILQDGLTIRGGVPEYRFYPRGAESGRLAKHELDVINSIKVKNAGWIGGSGYVTDPADIVDKTKWEKLENIDVTNIPVYKVTFDTN